ncbi:hypothetical protein [Amorphus orientalis]|uniref:Uncharacterized protein n=1 Tax=Amorphus orientalis TaxID=649198 RepID=A0AAE3VS37_9HYPH|nr:hypothetical protein [Amorphus orientalis]MDQ0317359.1 hypothetical protein [Amorphus orientalis]
MLNLADWRAGLAGVAESDNFAIGRSNIPPATFLPGGAAGATHVVGRLAHPALLFFDDVLVGGVARRNLRRFAT